jgi:[CysO sulfur-carrier protein]-thiocarboxylate-dependent cysteine synthase
VTGVARALRRSFPDIAVVATEPPVGETISGLRSMADGYVPPVFDAASRRSHARQDRAGDHDDATAGRRGGPLRGTFWGCSGHGAVRRAEALPPDSVVVTLLPDAGWKYLSTGVFDGSVEAAARTVEHATLW